MHDDGPAGRGRSSPATVDEVAVERVGEKRKHPAAATADEGESTASVHGQPVADNVPAGAPHPRSMPPRHVQCLFLAE